MRLINYYKNFIKIISELNNSIFYLINILIQKKNIIIFIIIKKKKILIIKKIKKNNFKFNFIYIYFYKLIINLILYINH